MPCFTPFDPAACCLCGGSADPTGEHKIKASSLRSQFGKKTMVVVRDGETVEMARGVKAKAFHFDTPMCAACNNERTQPADREYDLFMEAALALVASGSEPIGALENERYQPVSDANVAAYHNVLRYFSKLMAGHLAEAGAPRSDRLADYALGRSEDCPIMMGIDADRTYEKHAKSHADHSYAAHGGLVVFIHQPSGAPTAFFTSLTVGPVRCTLTYRLTDDERADLKALHRDFWDGCRAHGHDAIKAPVDREKLLKLGVADDRI